MVQRGEQQRGNKAQTLMEVQPNVGMSYDQSSTPFLAQ